MIDLYTVTNVPSYGLTKALDKGVGVRRQSYERFVFANGNMLIQLRRTDSRADRVLVVAFSKNAAGELLIELGLLIDALRRDYDAPIHCVLPYLHYSRSNRLSEPSSSFGARVYVNLLDALGADRYFLFDLHAPELLGFFRTPARQLSALPAISTALKRRAVRFDYVVAPDCGRYDDCRSLAGSHDATADFFTKWRRDHSGRSLLTEQRRTHLDGRTVLLFDDEVTTADTLVNAAGAASAAGATEIHVAVLYSFADISALKRLNEIRQIRSFTTTNLGIPIPEQERGQLEFEYEVVDCSNLLVPEAMGR
jgi:ribose-phosphate pyrophosphokinase